MHPAKANDRTANATRSSTLDVPLGTSSQSFTASKHMSSSGQYRPPDEVQWPMLVVEETPREAVPPARCPYPPQDEPGTVAGLPNSHSAETNRYLDVTPVDLHLQVPEAMPPLPHRL